MGEFIARLGLIALDNSVISGSLTVTGGITGSFQGTASFATTASNVLGGASNYIPLWNGATTLSSSVMYQSSGNIGIGTTSPASKLDVAGITAYNTGLILRGAASAGVGLNLKNTSGHDWYIISTGAGNDGGANNLGFYNHSVGNYLFYLKSDGNVGIGTTSPSEKLDVSGFIRSTSGLKVTDGTIDFRFSWASGNAGFIGNLSNHPISFYTNAAERMRLTAGGDLGIGTTSPQQKLVVSNAGAEGLEFIPAPSANSNQIQSYNRSTSAWNSLILRASEYNVQIGTTATLYISGSGNVGIGTTSPDINATGNRVVTITGAFTRGRLQLQNTDSVSAGAIGGSIEFLNGTNTIGLITGQLESSSTTAGFLRFDAGGNTERMRITSTGNVGIGVTSPSTRLHVSASTGGVLEVDGAGTAGANALYVSASGEVGIGTSTPNAVLNIVTPSADSTGYALITKGSSGKEFFSVHKLGFVSTRASDTNGANMHFYDNAGSKRVEMSVTSTNMNWYSDALATQFLTFQHSTGNIGIGTTSPAAKLDIAYSTNPTTATPHIILTTGGTAKQAAITAESFAVGGLVFSTGDGTLVDRMTILRTNGNVGIGTTSPGAKFHVVRASSEIPVIIDSSNAASSSYTQYRVNGSTGWEAGMAGSGDAYKWFFTYGAFSAANAKVAITSDGSVGIGTVSPSQKLHVEGDILIESGADSVSKLIISNGGAGNAEIIGSEVDGILRIKNGNSGVPVINFLNSSDTVMMSINNSNVGIGTTSPAVRLQVNGSTLITESLTVGQSTTGSSEHTLTVGVPSAAGAGEGGQILLAASGGLYTSASMLDNYQNRFRVLRGTNASSDAELLNVNLHSGQVTFNRYTGSGAFAGTAAANLAVDSSGNVITVAAGGGGGSVTINNNTDNYLITATGTANTLNGEANLQFNGSALTITGSLTVITGSVIELQVTNTGVNIGNASTDNHNITGSVNINGNINGAEPIPAGAKLYLFYNY